jgi:hypothetical protein
VAIAGAIAEFIRHHFYVINISPGEAQLLNSSQFAGGIGGKNNCARRLDFGDSPLERPKAAGIQIPHEKHTLPEWKPWKPGDRGKREMIKRLFLFNK